MFELCSKLSVPQQVDRIWVTEQLFNLNLAVRESSRSKELLTNRRSIVREETRELYHFCQLVSRPLVARSG